MPEPHGPSHDRGESGDAIARLRTLRQRLAEELRGQESLENVTGALGHALDEVLAEHRGMADELLSAYEGLGIVFDMTRRLPTAQRERAVVEMFAESLRHTFAESHVSVAWRRGERRWRIDHAAPANDKWLAALLERAFTQSRVLVEPAPPETIGRDIQEVLVGPVCAGDSLICAIVLSRPESAPALRAVDMLLVESLTTFCGDLIRNRRLVRELGELSVSMVRSLVNAVDQKDQYTCGHSLRVAYYATALGRRLKFDEIELQMLQWAALLHDVGKIGIKDAVLKKEGKLTTDEFEHMKEHPVRSHHVVQGIPQLAQALEGILHHHERYDGSGYPAGLVGEQIPLQARVIQIADVFDALTSNRSYRPAFEWSRALQIMKEEAGRTVDPHLQRVFGEMMVKALASDPGAWQRILDSANRFAPGEDDPLGQEGDN